MGLKFENMWDYSDPVASENSFYSEIYQQSDNAFTIWELQTQIANALRIQGKFDESRHILNSIQAGIEFAPDTHEKIITSIIGFGSGILGGLSTFYGPPMLAYIVAVDLPKEKFVRTVSTMYFIGSFPLYGSLIYYGFASKEDLLFSIFLIVPAFLGQQIGTRIRDKINQKQFRISILITLIILGISLFLKTI